MQVLSSYHFPCQMASDELTSATEPQKQKQRHFFFYRVARMRLCMCAAAVKNVD